MKGEELILQLDSSLQRQNVLYAFVAGSTVMYVGKTTQGLHRRMFGYRKPNVDQRTNWRNRIAIINLLKRGQPVEILALADTGLMRYGSFYLNLAGGLEDSIIATLKPEWNGGRTSGVIETPSNANPVDTSMGAEFEEMAQQIVQHLPQSEPMSAVPHFAVESLTDAKAALPTTRPEDKVLTTAPYFLLTLQNTYHRTGFFNVPLNSDRYFGKGDQSIIIYCGREKLIVTGKINRTANTNGTPRIMGAIPLRQWFQKRKPMSQLKVSMLDPTTIHINDA